MRLTTTKRAAALVAGLLLATASAIALNFPCDGIILSDNVRMRMGPDIE
jgi:hypothetical protein